MTSRTEQKQQSRDRILDAAGRRLRAEGLGGAGIADVMADAGLTHGAFYAHFADKDELVREALVQALAGNRQAWMGQSQTEPWRQRLSRLAGRYLTTGHRQQRSDGCALSALSSDAGRSDDVFRRTYEQELLKSLSAVCEDDFAAVGDQQADEALAFMALMVGSLTLSRAVRSEALAERLLAAGRAAAAKLVSVEEQP